MPCPHHDIKIIQRSNHQSAVASAAYQSGERLFSGKDQKQKYPFPKKKMRSSKNPLPPPPPHQRMQTLILLPAPLPRKRETTSPPALRASLSQYRKSPEQHADLIRDYCREFCF